MKLQAYFNNLKFLFKLPADVKLRWIPDDRCRYRGFVSDDNTIFIFDTDESRARETLLHEIVDMLITRLAVKLANNVKSRYWMKEAVVDTLIRALRQSDSCWLIPPVPAKKVTREDVERAKEKLRRLKR